LESKSFSVSETEQRVNWRQTRSVCQGAAERVLFN
jgi:hypothetical protein